MPALPTTNDNDVRVDFFIPRAGRELEKFLTGGADVQAEIKRRVLRRALNAAAPAHDEQTVSGSEGRDEIIKCSSSLKPELLPFRALRNHSPSGCWRLMSV